MEYLNSDELTDYEKLTVIEECWYYEAKCYVEAQTERKRNVHQEHSDVLLDSYLAIANKLGQRALKEKPCTTNI